MRVRRYNMNRNIACAALAGVALTVLGFVTLGSASPQTHGGDGRFVLTQSKWRTLTATEGGPSSIDMEEGCLLLDSVTGDTWVLVWSQTTKKDGKVDSFNGWVPQARR